MISFFLSGFPEADESLAAVFPSVGSEPVHRGPPLANAVCRHLRIQGGGHFCGYVKNPFIDLFKRFDAAFFKDLEYGKLIYDIVS